MQRINTWWSYSLYVISHVAPHSSSSSTCNIKKLDELLVCSFRLLQWEVRKINLSCLILSTFWVINVLLILVDKSPFEIQIMAFRSILFNQIQSQNQYTISNYKRINQYLLCEDKSVPVNKVHLETFHFTIQVVDILLKMMLNKSWITRFDLSTCHKWFREIKLDLHNYQRLGERF